MTALWVPEPKPSKSTSNGHAPVYSRVDFKTLTEEYDLVEVTDDVIIVSERPNQLAEPDMRELGASGGSSYNSMGREDYNPKLRGQSGLRIWDEMRKSDGQVAMALTLKKLPILSARWYIQPASASKKDKKIADYIWKNLTHQMSVSWPLWLTESLAFLDFGWYAFEKVFEKVDGLMRWKKFAPRHPMDSMGWSYDRNGGPVGCRFPAAIDDADLERLVNGRWVVPSDRALEIGEGKLIEIEKLLVLTNNKEGGNMEGVSALRPAYKHWFFKDNLYKIDAIQKERHAIGIPVIKLPVNFTDADKRLANNMGRNLRTNEKAHVVLPPLWELEMLELQGNPVDVIASIEHHDTQIARQVLAPFMQGGKGNSNEGDASTLSDLYMKASRISADVVRDVINKWAIPELVGYNWGSNAAENPPELRVRRIGETVDWRTISFTLRNLVGANLLRPDKPLLDSMREEFDLPEVDEATIIETISPQMPGQAGPPRQSQAKNQKSSPTANAGKDGSGKAQGN